MSLKSEFIPVQFKITSRSIIELWGKVQGGGGVCGGFPPTPIKFPKISISNIINYSSHSVTVDKNKPWIPTPPHPHPPTPMKQNYPLGTPPSLLSKNPRSLHRMKMSWSFVLWLKSCSKSGSSMACISSLLP